MQFVDMALAAELNLEEERVMHHLKAELLGALGDKESSFIAKNIYYNGHNLEMKSAGVEEAT